jgi:molybdopterin-guanine dinucleotide biosynthesis protein A
MKVIPDATAIILTGGKSSRMGRPKALLPFGNEPLILHIVGTLKGVFPEVVVVAAPGDQFVELSSLLCSPNKPNDLNQPNQPKKLNELKLTLVRDEIPYQGPVGGIYYGLKAAEGNFCFVTSCDVAFLNLPLIAHLMSQISNYDVVVPYWQERFQPLHAFYRRSVLPLLKEQLERGELRPIYLFDKVRTRKIDENEIRHFDPEGLSFLNMNTPEDYDAALKRWEEIRQRQETETTPLPSISISVSVPVSVTVELFGVPRLLAKTKAVPLPLPQDATLSHVLSALAERHPVLVGRVITPDGNGLSSGYACNINGLDFVRNPRAKVNPGDKIFILSADAGG